MDPREADSDSVFNQKVLVVGSKTLVVTDSVSVVFLYLSTGMEYENIL